MFVPHLPHTGEHIIALRFVFVDHVGAAGGGDGLPPLPPLLSLLPGEGPRRPLAARLDHHHDGARRGKINPRSFEILALYSMLAT